MKRPSAVACLLATSGVAVLALASLGSGGAPTASPPSAPPELAERYALVAPLVGHAWEINGAWADGRPIWARNEWRVGLNGQFVESRIFVTDESGDNYQRYHTVMSVDADTGVYRSYGFTYDGTANVVDNETKDSPDGDPMMVAEWDTPEGGMRIRQEVEFELDRGRYLWRVWMRPAGDEAAEWAPLMVDSVWERKEKLAG